MGSVWKPSQLLRNAVRLSAKEGLLDSMVTELLQSIALLIVPIVHFVKYGLDIFFFFSFSFVKCGLSLSPGK